MPARRPLIAGNWKMHGLTREAQALAAELAKRARNQARPAFDMAVCPPFTAIAAVATAVAGTWLAVGGQDCHTAEKGAHTGDISAAMLADAGCAFVIVGHSERRIDHREKDALVKAKAGAAIKAGLVAIVCIGETARERDKGQTLDIVESQLAGSLPVAASATNAVVAYEPVWAIGSGRTPSAGEVQQVHAYVRALIAKRLGKAEAAAMRILYGGSVKADNADRLMRLPDVDGGLIGGASLKADDFWAIAEASV